MFPTSMRASELWVKSKKAVFEINRSRRQMSMLITFQQIKNPLREFMKTVEN
jgi:hypothetical protein